MKKKYLLYALTVCLMLAGCNSGEKSGGVSVPPELDPDIIGYYGDLTLPIDDKNTEISVLCTSSVGNINDSVVVEELRKRTGLNVQIIALPAATIKEKTKTLLASKDSIPDILRGSLLQEEINDFGMQGAFEPIEPHLDELPNLKEIFYDEDKNYKTTGLLRNLKASDGQLYTFPKYDIERDVNHGMLYRKDIFDAHNIPMWSSPEGFHSALKQLKEIYPESDPFVSKNGIGIINKLGQSWGIEFPNPYYDEQAKVWKHSVVDEKTKELLDFVRRLYDEKLIDPEFLTTTQAAWTAKMTQAEKAFVTFDWIGRLDMFYEQAVQNVPDYDLRFANPVGPTGKVITLSKVAGGSVVKSGNKSLLALKLCDYLISESGAQLMTMGIEGVTYELDENNFAKYYGFEEGKAIAITDLEDKYGMFLSGLYGRFDRRSVYFNYTEKEKEAQEMMLNKKGGGFLPEDPILTFTAEEKEINSENMPRIKTAAEEFATKYILSAETGDLAWNTWLEKAKTLGVDEVINNYNKAQGRYDEL